MQYVGLNIILKASANVALVVESSEADRLLSDFAKGGLVAKLGSHNVRCHPEVPTWCVDTKDIAGMHTLDPQALRQGSQAGAVQAPPAQKSVVGPQQQGQFPSLSRQELSGFKRAY